MKLTHKIKQLPHLLSAAVLLFAVISVVLPGKVSAYGQLTSRSVVMSSTANGATNVAYDVNFTTVTNNQTIGSVVIKFCANSPIIGDGCSAPTGFDTNYSTLTLGGSPGNITGLSVDTTNSTANILVLTRTPGTVANGAVSIVLGNGTTTGITNPTNANTTFYAKMLTFASDTPTLTAAAESASAIDAGGTAISTASELNVTAKVQESLVFCVYTGADCTEGGTAVAIGDTNGVLASTTTTYTSTAKFDVASNAVAGVKVRLKGDTLKSGTFSIDGYGSSCTADSSSSASEQFGLRMSVLGTGVTASAPYNCSAGSHGYDVSGTTAMYGHQIAQTSGATDVASSTIEFAAKSANTTEAGVYTTKLTLIATATY